MMIYICTKFFENISTVFKVIKRTLFPTEIFKGQSSELYITENCLPLTDEVTVVLVLNCLQHLHLLALHLEILGYIPHLLNGLVYLRRMGDFRGDSLIVQKPKSVATLESTFVLPK